MQALIQGCLCDDLGQIRCFKSLCVLKELSFAVGELLAHFRVAKRIVLPLAFVEYRRDECRQPFSVCLFGLLTDGFLGELFAIDETLPFIDDFHLICHLSWLVLACLCSLDQTGFGVPWGWLGKFGQDRCSDVLKLSLFHQCPLMVKQISLAVVRLGIRSLPLLHKLE